MLTFAAKNHLYESLPTQTPIAWVSGTGLLGHLKNPFPVDQNVKSSKRKPTAASPNKWFGLSPALIQRLWDGESLRASTDGTWFHDGMERGHLLHETVPCFAGLGPDGEPVFQDVPVVGCEYDIEGRKLAPVQRMEEGSFPERLLYLKSAGICGQADLCDRAGDYINIGDYKTNKKLDKNSYSGWQGPKMMLGPVGHLEDCNFNPYSLQLSLYMWLALKHNPGLKPGRLTIHHIKFKQVQYVNEATGELQPLFDQYEYPIYERTEDGHPVFESSTPHAVPYLKREVEEIIRWFTANKHTLPQKAK